LNFLNRSAFYHSIVFSSFTLRYFDRKFKFKLKNLTFTTFDVCRFFFPFFYFFFNTFFSFNSSLFAFDKLLWNNYIISSSRSISTFSPNNLLFNTMLTNSKS
jgi:hypothetical protein